MGCLFAILGGSSRGWHPLHHLGEDLLSWPRRSTRHLAFSLASSSCRLRP